MKKFFIVLGVVFSCLVLIGAIFIAVVAYKGSRLDTESKAFVNHVVPLIAKSWDTKILMDNASPELLKVVPQKKINIMFKWFAERLGSLKEYKGTEGDSLISLSNKVRSITANYTARASFERAEASIKIRLIKHGDKWQVLELNVTSDALMP